MSALRQYNHEEPDSHTGSEGHPETTSPQISIIVPVYNEQERIAASLYEIKDYLENLEIHYEVLVIDDGSNDLTSEIVKFVESWGFNSIARLLGLVTVKDSQCGFKAYQREVAIEVAQRQKTSRFCFDVEHLYIARKLGYIITEVPVVWNHDEGSSLSLLRDSTVMLIDLIRIRLLHRNL